MDYFNLPKGIRNVAVVVGVVLELQISDLQLSTEMDI